MTSRKIEQLMTNNIVLRLVAISKDRARERYELDIVEKEIMYKFIWFYNHITKMSNAFNLSLIGDNSCGVQNVTYLQPKDAKKRNIQF